MTRQPLCSVRRLMRPFVFSWSPRTHAGVSLGFPIGGGKYPPAPSVCATPCTREGGFRHGYLCSPCPDEPPKNGLNSHRQKTTLFVPFSVTRAGTTLPLQNSEGKGVKIRNTEKYTESAIAAVGWCLPSGVNGLVTAILSKFSPKKKHKYFRQR